MAVHGQTIRVGRRGITITRPAKVLFPADGVTKRDLVDYYCRIGPWILPHLRDRPLAMERYPDGIGEPSFFQKAVPPYYPDWIERVTVQKAGGTITHVICNNEATLVYLANQACITPHIWLSRIEKLHCPDQMVFDLDPSGDSFDPVAKGEIKVGLYGKKLRGGFVLVRPGGRLAEPGQRTRWLLIKLRDVYADPSWRIDEATLDRSVASGRPQAEIKRG